jgi:tetratricopeptide (TPR) repeat protein
VVVAPFENRTGQSTLDPVGSMAADWIIQGLSHTGLVDVVPVTAALTAADFVIRSPGGTDSAERIRLLARETTAGIVVAGAYYLQADSLYLRATVTDVSAGRVLHALAPIATHVALPLEGIEQLRQRVIGGLAHWGLASSALWVNRPAETIRVSRQLDPERGELRGWFFYWRDLAHAHHRLGEHREELRVTRRARELFPDERSAVLLEVRALAALGRHRELNRLLAEPVHADRNPMVLYQAAGQELLAHGSSAQGEALLRAALDLYRSQPSEDPRFRFFRASSHRLVGEREEAGRLPGELAAEQPGVLTMSVQGTLGGLAARRGDITEAARISGWLAELDSPNLRGGNTYFRARIASLLGERDEALRLLQQSQREGVLDFWLVIHTEPDFASLRDHPPFREFTRPKR